MNFELANMKNIKFSVKIVCCVLIYPNFVIICCRYVSNSKPGHDQYEVHKMYSIPKNIPELG